MTTELADDDAALAGRAADGDLRAFAVLVERHEAAVHRLARRFVGAQEAEDVSQDVFLRAFHRLRGFRGDAPFRTWLLRITRNAALDHLARRPPTAVDPGTLEQTPTDGPREPAARLETRERIERIETKLRFLSDEHRTVLVLRDIEGLSYREIIDVTDWPLGSVKGRLHRARREFIALLRANTYDWELPS